MTLDEELLSKQKKHGSNLYLMIQRVVKRNTLFNNNKLIQEKYYPLESSNNQNVDGTYKISVTFRDRKNKDIQYEAFMLIVDLKKTNKEIELYDSIGNTKKYFPIKRFGDVILLSNSLIERFDFGQH